MGLDGLILCIIQYKQHSMNLTTCAADTRCPHLLYGSIPQLLRAVPLAAFKRTPHRNQLLEPAGSRSSVSCHDLERR